MTTLPTKAGDKKRERPESLAGLVSTGWKWLFLQGGHLKEKVLRGGIWLVLGDAFNRAAGIVKLAILGRLLSPHDFGLMGIAMVILNGIQYFTETGFNTSLIQKPGDVRPYLHTAWTVQILRSAGVALTLVLAAPLGARFFDNLEATAVIRAVALITLLRGFTNPSLVYLRKDLDFRPEVLLKLCGSLAGLLVAVAVALRYRNVWALVLSVIAAQAVETVLSYQVVPYRPRFQLDWEKARELFRFGRWIFWFNVVGYFGLYTDSLVTGKLLGAAALGFYQVASQLSTLPTTQIAMHLRGVMFPAFAQMQKSPDLPRIFLKTLSALSWVVIPIGSFVCVFAEPIVGLVLGPKWISIRPTLQVLAWAGVGTALGGIANPLLMGIGVPKLAVRNSILKVLVLGILIYPLTTRLGILGVALALTLASLAAAAYNLVLALQVLKLSGWELAKGLRGGLVGSVPFLIAAVIIRLSQIPWIEIAIAVIAIAAYLALVLPALKTHLAQRSVIRNAGPGSASEAEAGIASGV